MFSFLFRKEKLVERMIDEYLEHYSFCVENFETAMKNYCQKGLGADFDFWVKKTHKEEATLDDLRRDIELALYSKALIPESRRDVLELLESIDRVPNKVESVLFHIQCEEIKFPQPLMLDLETLVQHTCDTSRKIIDLTKNLFARREKIKELTQLIDKDESYCDHVERQIIRKIFQGNMDTGEKLQLKGLILEIGDITDRAEDISDKVTIISVKGQV